MSYCYTSPKIKSRCFFFAKGTKLHSLQNWYTKLEHLILPCVDLLETYRIVNMLWRFVTWDSKLHLYSQRFGMKAWAIFVFIKNVLNLCANKQNFGQEVLNDRQSAIVTGLDNIKLWNKARKHSLYTLNLQVSKYSKIFTFNYCEISQKTSTCFALTSSWWM